MPKRVKLRGYLCTLYRYQPIKQDMNANPRHKIEDEVWHHSTKVVQNVQHQSDESDSLSHIISLKLSIFLGMCTFHKGKCDTEGCKGLIGVD
jgi:hypothetical protein